jgi:hypothetical protein
MNGDGHADVVTGAGPGVPQPVKIFSGENTSLLASWLPFGTLFKVGLWVAAAGQVLRGRPHTAGPCIGRAC